LEGEIEEDHDNLAQEERTVGVPADILNTNKKLYPLGQLA
jgi:hypothetical protein